MKSRVVRYPILALVAALIPAACSDVPSGLRVQPAPDVAALVASSARGLSSTAPRAWLSLPAHSVNAGGDVIVTNRVNGSTLRRPLVNGGFDPVGIDALPGDELRIEFPGTGLIAARIAAALPPVIVRTDPVRRRASVPLNIRMTLVFSEPMDPATITSAAIRLVGPSGAEPVTLDLTDEGTIVVITPVALLRAASPYRLEVAASVADLTGDPLESAEVVDFTTAGIEEGPVAAVRLCPDSLRLPIGATSGFVVVVDSGRRLINSLPDPDLTWQSRDTAIVRAGTGGDIHAVALGRAWILVSYKGDTDSAQVIVTSWPPPGPFGIWPGGAVMPIGHVQKFEVSREEGSPAPDVTWSVSDPAIISVGATGDVTGLAAGTAWVHAATATQRDSAEVEVYDPAPKLGDLYRIRPDSVLFQTGNVLWLAVSGPDNPPPVVTWSVADEAIATISERGAITAVAEGRTTVSARFSDGSTTEASVIVVAPGTLGTISLEPLAPTVQVGDTLRFNVILDAQAQALWGNQGSAWTLAGGALRMQLNAAGSFIAVTPGTATVRAYAGPLWAQTTVTVVP